MLVTACTGGTRDGAESKRATLGSLLGIAGDAGATYNSLQQQAEELIATCMTDAGWEYIPVQWPDTRLTTASDEDEVARITRVGLGAVSSLLNEDGDALGYGDPYADFVNPNDAYIASLSDDEKAAYDESLYGTAEKQETTVSTTFFDPTTGLQMTKVMLTSGCSGDADAAVFQNAGTQTDAQASAISVYWDELQTRFKADPRTVKLDERWVACMKDSGYDYASPHSFHTDAFTEYSTKASGIVGGSVSSDPMEGWTEDQIDAFWATATDEEIAALTPANQVFTAEQRTQLEALQTQEIAVALADHACTASLKDESAAIYADVEEKYALAHKDELTALAASLAGGT